MCQIVAQVAQCSLYPAISPGAILLSHADSQSSDFVISWRPARASTWTLRVLNNQFSVPRQQSFRLGDRCHLPQRLAASCVALAANHRRWSLLNLRRRSPTCCRRTRFSSIRYAMTFCWCWLIQPAIVVSQHNHLNEIEFLNTTGLLENLGPGKCDHRVHDAAGWPNSLAGRTEEDFLVKRIQRDS